MKKHESKILVGVTLLMFLFVFGCKTIPVNKSEPKFKPVYNEVLDKTYIIPSELPDPYDEKVLAGYGWNVFSLSPNLPMIMYWEVDGNGEGIEGLPIFALVFDVETSEIVAAALYINQSNGKYWVYKDGKNPFLCKDEYEQENWLYEYDTNRVEKKQVSKRI